MADRSGEWMARERWDALVRGDGCPACDEVQTTAVEHEQGFFVTDLDVSRLRLARNQFIPGYCVLLARRHVREPYELDREDRARFFEDMLQVGRALEHAFGAIKLNFEILGNAVPHLHVHIKPRYYGDPAPNRIIDQNAEHVYLTPRAYEERVERIRSVLRTSDPRGAW